VEGASNRVAVLALRRVAHDIRELRSGVVSPVPTRAKMPDWTEIITKLTSVIELLFESMQTR
jgi:hypothetical protein